MRVEALPGPFGAVVSGIDLAQDMGDATMRRLIDLLHESQILVIRGQRLENADYARFGRFWGKPLGFMIKSQTRDDFPEIIRITNAASTPLRMRDGAVHWHSDSTYEDVPASVTMLYGVVGVGAGSPARGSTGPLRVTDTPVDHVVTDAMVKAWQEAGNGPRLGDDYEAWICAARRRLFARCIRGLCARSEQPEHSERAPIHLRLDHCAGGGDRQHRECFR